MIEIVRKKIKVSSYHTWILFFIIVFGIFLRTYEFQNWLKFERDQVRDAFLVNDVIEGKTSWPLLGSTMKDSQDKNGNLFRIGPAYNYMQIISAKIFGNEPDKLAYPDLFFSILTILLFYFFLRKIFSPNISLLLIGAYSVSAFAVRYSRFAWNPNSIPFFSILFLLSLHEFLLKKEKVPWMWIFFCGISIGIGMQLHVIILILFPTVAFFVFAYLLKKNWRLWKKIFLTLVLVIIVNSFQLISEYRTGFSNTRTFFNTILFNDLKENSDFSKNLRNNLNCHMEANAYMLTSLGKDKCAFSYEKILKRNKSKRLKKEIKKPIFLLSLILVSLFSFLGYFFLAYHSLKEKKNDRRLLLRLVTLYLIISFVLIMPVISSDHTEFRYFIHLFFIPFIFLGFGLDFLLKKYSNKHIFLFFIFSLFLVVSNIFSSWKEVEELYSENRSNDHFVVLGELKKMEEYVRNNSDNKKEVLLVGSGNYVSNFSSGLNYFAQKNNYKINDIRKDYDILKEKPLFYITYSDKKNPKNFLKDRPVEKYKKFGKVLIYKLKNSD